jgi:hypothetical protein
VCVFPAVQSGGASSEGIHLGPIKEGSSADSFLLPEDLVHLTRRSLFLIIDSDNSTSFSKLQVRGTGGCSIEGVHVFMHPHQDPMG